LGRRAKAEQTPASEGGRYSGREIREKEGKDNAEKQRAPRKRGEFWVSVQPEEEEAEEGETAG
jgi:hypothetical protein